MKKINFIKFLLFLFIIISILFINCPNNSGDSKSNDKTISGGEYLRSRRLGGYNNDKGFSITIGSGNDIIVTGQVSGNADLSGNGIINYYMEEDVSGSFYGGYDIFMSGFSYKTVPLWIRRYGGSNNDDPGAVTIDNYNNIIITGTVNGSANLNGDGAILGGEDVSGSSVYGGDDIFIYASDSSGGIAGWKKRLGGTGDDWGATVTTDSDNNIIVGGNVNGNADLNGDGDSSDSGAESAAGYGEDDIFFSVFNSLGEHQWSKRIGGIGYDLCKCIKTDNDNNIIILAQISGDVDFNGDGDYDDEGESASGYGVYNITILKLSSSGSYLWSKRLGGINVDRGLSIAIDNSNHIIITGHVIGNADLNGDGDSSDGGAESASGYGGYDIFVSKFNSSGSYIWSKRLGGINDDTGHGVTTDNEDNIIIAGYVNSNADLNGDGDTADGGGESASGYGGYDIFVSKFNSSGSYIWSKRLGGINDDYGYDVITDSEDNIILTGEINGDADLNGDGIIADRYITGERVLPGSVYGNGDIFISKFSK